MKLLIERMNCLNEINIREAMLEPFLTSFVCNEFSQCSGNFASVPVNQFDITHSAS